MSKLARTLQTAAAKTNWNETVKMLFWSDRDPGRSERVRGRDSGELQSPTSAGVSAESYSPDQFQYMLMLMLIISIAEKRTQELYDKEFTDRCDAISKDHRLQDDRYWEDGQVPAEWETLSGEFEVRSLQILSDTLREYKQDDIADLIATDGLDQLFNIVEGVRSQFFKVLESPRKESVIQETTTEGSIPESLQPQVSNKGSQTSAERH